jgi:uncharacterized membrane protein YbaN (DUF454 family)
LTSVPWQHYRARAAALNDSGPSEKTDAARYFKADTFTMTNLTPSLKPSWQRPIYAFLGCVSLAIGIVALVVPLIPGIVFLALAAACFSRSSPAMDRWLTTHPRFGKLITNWQTSGAISRTTKWVITASMVASFSLIFLETQSRGIQAVVAVIMLAVLVYVWRRPEQPSLPAVAQA